MVPVLILIALAVMAVFVPEGAPTVAGGAIDSGDTAWMLTATCLVLLMTPGLSLFHGGMVSRKNVIESVSPAAPSSTCRPAWRRCPAPCSSGPVASTRKVGRTWRRTSAAVPSGGADSRRADA